MRIEKPELTRRDGHFEYRASVEAAGCPEAVWYRVPGTYADFISKRADAAVTALLIPAMATGEDIRVRGTLSARLFYSFTGPYQYVLRRVMPWLKPVTINADDVQPAPPPALGVATGFSAGIDSFSLLARHHYADDVPPGFRITHLLYNNVGSHGPGKAGERLFRARYERLRPTAERIGLPFIPVNTNLWGFYYHHPLMQAAPRYYFSQHHTPLNVSVALLLQGGIGRFLYAPGHPYQITSVEPSAFIGYSDLATLPLLSTGALHAHSADGEYTRIEKTIRVAEVEDSYTSLDVCVDHGGAENCSACPKCLRTLLTLEISGHLARYAGVFDLDVYRQHRAKHMTEVLVKQSPFTREIRAFAEEKGFPFPFSARLGALWLRLSAAGAAAHRGLRRAARRMLSRPLSRLRNVLRTSSDA